MPKARGYLRVSHVDQAEDGNSIDTQRNIVQRKFEELREKMPGLEWGDWYIDNAVSAYRHPMLKRAEGVRLNGDLKPGDVVICARVDRAFRNLVDQQRMMQIWKDRGIKAYYCDFPLVDSDSAVGWMMFTLMGVFAEVFSRQASERIKMGIKNKRLRGLTTSKAPAGYKKIRSNILKGDVLVPDEKCAEIGKFIDGWYQKGLRYKLISDEVEGWLAAKEERKSRRGIRSRYRYDFHQCQDIHEYYLSTLVVRKDPNRVVLASGLTEDNK